jgi:flagellar protein FliL
MRRLLPLLLGLLGLAAGVGAGLLLRPAPPAAEAEAMAEAQAPAPRPTDTTVLRMPNPFLVPLIGEGRVRAMVVVSVALELLPGHTIDLQRDEARLRALFLQLIFDYANLGGFDGVFTSGEQLLTLRRTLREAAQAEFGPMIHDILLIDLLRQDS